MSEKRENLSILQTLTVSNLKEIWTVKGTVLLTI